MGPEATPRSSAMLANDAPTTLSENSITTAASSSMFFGPRTGTKQPAEPSSTDVAFSGHIWHLTFPESELKVPGMQGRQEMLPSTAVWNPTGHREQAVVRLLAENDPGLHMLQDAELRS